jgi:hypothetical protein
MKTLGSRLEKLIDERNKLKLELRRVDAEQAELRCAMDRSTTKLADMVGLRLFGDPPPPFNRKG